jgi:hypothetical protein
VSKELIVVNVTLWVVVVVALVFVPGGFAQGIGDKCSLQPPIKEVLVNAKEIELFSLDPAIKAEEARTKFQGWAVLGSTKVTEKDVRAKLLKEVEAGISQSRYVEMALCFHPRHGVRAKAGELTVELVICFECSWVKVYVNGQGIRSEATKEAPQKYLDELLTAAKIPLASKPAKDK